MKKRLVSIAVIFFMISGVCNIDKGYAASVGVSVSGASCQVGQNVNVTIAYSGGYPALAKFSLSYDTSKLELVSSGGLYANGNAYLMESNNAGAASISATFTFRAKAAGDAYVSVSTIEGVTWNDEMFGGSASATVKISSASSGGGSSSTSGGSSSTSGGSSSSNKKPSSNTNGRGDFTDTSLGTPDDPQSEEEAVDPSEKPDQIQITIGDKTYIIVEDLSEKKMTEGFTAADSKYGEYEWKIQVAKSDESKYTLILLKDSETDEESWFFYDEETGQVTSSTSLDVMGTLEYERLLLESEEQADDNVNTYLIVLSCILGAAVIGLGGYMIYTKRGKLKRHDDDWE